MVSSHSKGGNLAQYVTLFASETLIDRCLIFDGQGFSEELCSTPRCQKTSELNGDRLYTIASANNPVNVLLNAAVPEEHMMYITANPEDGIGKSLTYLLNVFIQYVIKNVATEKNHIIFDGLMPITSNYKLYWLYLDSIVKTVGKEKEWKK